VWIKKNQKEQTLAKIKGCNKMSLNKTESKIMSLLARKLNLIEGILDEDWEDYEKLNGIKTVMKEE